MFSRFLLPRLERLVAHYRQGGIGRILKHLAYYACVHNWLIWLADMQILGLAGPAESQALDPLSDYVFRFATEMDLNAILVCAPLVDRSHLDKLFRKFFRDGYRCVIALFEKQVAGYMWAFTGEYVITFDDYRRHSISVRLEPDSVFTGNAYVTPPHRRRGLFKSLKLYLMQHYPSDTGFYTSISDLNTPSLAANHRLGFRELATLRVVRVFWYTRFYIRANGSRHWRPCHPRGLALKLRGMRVLTEPANFPANPES